MGGAKHSQLFEIRADPMDSSTKAVKVRIALFTDVENATELKSLLKTGSLDCCLIRADLILEIFQVLAAAQRAVSCQATEKMITKSLNSELLYSLSPSKNITESLILFGIADDTRNILVVVVGDDGGSKISGICKKIKGKMVPLDEIKDIGNYSLVKQIYNVGDPELNKGTVMDAVLARMISKDCTTYT